MSDPTPADYARLAEAIGMVREGPVWRYAPTAVHVGDALLAEYLAEPAQTARILRAVPLHLTPDANRYWAEWFSPEGLRVERLGPLADSVRDCAALALRP